MLDNRWFVIFVIVFGLSTLQQFEKSKLLGGFQDTVVFSGSNLSGSILLPMLTSQRDRGLQDPVPGVLPSRNFRSCDRSW
jgi:hypothetical protein